MGEYAVGLTVFAAALYATIFIHEIGHAMAAKKRGHWIVQLSVGNLIIFRRRIHGTEVRMGLLPFSGFVEHKDLKTWFSNQSNWQDAAIIAAAGPLANLILAMIGISSSAFIGFATNSHARLMDLLQVKPYQTIFGYVFWVLADGWHSASLAGVLLAFGLLNFAVAAMNLIPFSPADGGHLVTALLTPLVHKKLNWVPHPNKLVVRIGYYALIGWSLLPDRWAHFDVGVSLVRQVMP